MKMTFRWFGPDQDSISLAHIAQIPGLDGVVGCLLGVPVGQAWPSEAILGLKSEIESYGLGLEVIESVNVHEEIKLGGPRRDEYIDAYILTLRRLGEAGIKVVCYNFMPVFDWFRTELSHPLPDGSTALFYEAAKARDLSPRQVVDKIAADSGGFELPGWEASRLTELDALFNAYSAISPDTLLANLGYFLKAIMPACHSSGIKMAIHPDDPPWPIFGLPRVVFGQANLDRILDMVDDPHNGLTLCSGSLGADPANDIPALVRRYGARGRIHFAHVRNLKREANGDFAESAHLSRCGSLNLFDIMKAYHDVGYSGYMRPDHGRMIWDERGRPGYGLYDRALGIAYINGLWEAIDRMKGEGHAQ